MRFYTDRHEHYCGIDLHAKTMYLCILDAHGSIKLHRKFPTTEAALKEAIAPYRQGLVIGVECIFTWYWVANFCARESIAFVLGHALYMRAVHGAKAKNDRIDAEKIARLLAGQLMPRAYVYPEKMRATRDLLRRRLGFVRRRAELLAHIKMTFHQYNLSAPGDEIRSASNRVGLAQAFSDPSVAKNIEADVAELEVLDRTIAQLERFLEQSAKEHDPTAFALLKTIPGVGRILGLTLLYEIHDIQRFVRPQHFASYARLVKCEHSSDGKRLGTGGAKMGNVHLKWAFSEAAVLFVSKCAEGERLRSRLEQKHGKGKALSILAHRLGRAVWYMLARKSAFDLNRFLHDAA